MSRRSRRILWPSDRAALIEALEKCRTVCCNEGARNVPINGKLYKALHRVTEAIDEIAVILTGDRSHFWGKGHSTPEAAKPTKKIEPGC